jgi:hypothetical protein
MELFHREVATLKQGSTIHNHRKCRKLHYLVTFTATHIVALASMHFSFFSIVTHPDMSKS